MGQCYDISLRIRCKDMNAVERALKEKIFRDEENRKVNYSLAKYEQEGVKPDDLQGLLRIFFAGWKSTPYRCDTDPDGWLTCDNSFNASYGWEAVMWDMFESIGQWLEDGSRLEILPDSGSDLLIVRQGKVKISSRWNINF